MRNAYEDSKPSRAQRREAQRLKAAWIAVLADPAGRLVLRELLAMCDPYAPLPRATEDLHRAAGIRDAGYRIAGRIVAAVGQVGLATLLSEHAAEQDRADKGDPDEDDDE